MPEKDRPREADVGLSRFSRPYLLLTAFLSGASVLIIELIGNRILAPWFGNSLYTWTSLIGVILFSLSAGYYLGGYLADRLPRQRVLAHLLLLSGLLTCLVPPLRSVLESSMGTAGLIVGPVVAATALFALPSVILAALSPFAVKLLSQLTANKTVGVSAGLVGMLSSLGSVLGTFAAGFVLIPRFSINTILLTIGGVLMALAIVGYWCFASDPKRGKQLAILGTALGFLGAALNVASVSARHATLVFEQTTFYHRIRVNEFSAGADDKVRQLTLDTTAEGAQYLHSKEMVYDYPRYWRLAKVLCPQLERAAFLGGGAFAMPEALLDEYPAAQVDVVEIDPALVAVAHRFFRAGEYPRMRIIAEDARRFLRHTDAKYDLIFGDAYNGIRAIPSHLTTLEFFNLVDRRLTPQGVYVMNIIATMNGPNSAVYRSFVRTLNLVFADVCAFAVEPSEDAAGQNIILVAAKEPPTLQERLSSWKGDDPRVPALLDSNVPIPHDPEAGIVLRDDCNPIEFMIAHAIANK